MTMEVTPRRRRWGGGVGLPAVVALLLPPPLQQQQVPVGSLSAGDAAGDDAVATSQFGLRLSLPPVLVQIGHLKSYEHVSDNESTLHVAMHANSPHASLQLYSS